ncbi:MAG TPA: YkvA family protein [Pseudonocardiaceae bacterium]|nr:YkvA family protein [Pseudonocardiaceae bacterium]
MARSGKIRRLVALRALWRTVREGRRAGGPTVGERFSALPRLAGNAARGRYPGLGGLRLAGIVLALLYLLSPVDVLPELFLPLLGLGDDALVALWLAGTFFDETERYLRWERTGGGLSGPGGPDRLGDGR